MLVVITAAFAAACFHVYHKVQVGEVSTDEPTFVTSPVKAHLADGSVVIWAHGVTVSRTVLEGSGMRWDALRRDSTAVATVAMDSVLGLESYTRGIDGATTFGVSLLATAGMTVVTLGAGIAIACALDPKCFGSCPTVYSTSTTGELLEAELFSYSVAPLLEARDVDLLAARPDSTGRLELEIRNEALETHFINHIELLEVRHGADETVVPDAHGRPIVLGARSPVAQVRDRSGRDVAPSLAAHDSLHFASDNERLDRASITDFNDWIDLTVPRPASRDSIAVVLRMRNSLLNTVLFYDLMLGSAGARALDWLGTDLQRIGPAVELGMWYRARMGMRVAAEIDGAFRDIDRIPDAGPIAWKDVALLVPVPQSGDSMRIRLSFVTDEWRIDQVGIALDARRAEPRSVPLLAAASLDDTISFDATRRLSEPDEAYVETQPGIAFTVRFGTGPEPSGETRTFLLSSQGYYTEWVRPDWIARASTPATFEPGDVMLVEAQRRWRAVKPEFERRFYETRIPVR
jgi:hypothetical protein